MVKRKDGRYQEYVTIDGCRRYFYGSTKSEVLKKIQTYKEAAKNGRMFDVVADEWYYFAADSLAYNTTKSYKPALKRAKEAFEGVLIRTIEPKQIYKEILKMAKTYADKTVRHQLLVYNLIFKYAITTGDVTTNPARDISVPQGLKKEKRHAPDENVLRVVKQSVNCTFGLFAYMALYTGLRKGELLALDWSDVDVKNRTISVSKSVYHINNSPHIKKPKTAASASAVPILDALLPHLKRKKRGLVFPNEYGGLMTETQYQRLWELYQREAGITLTVHQLRHAYATMLYEADVPPEKAMALLRHAQISTTIDVYTDLRENRKKEIFESVYSVDIDGYRQKNNAAPKGGI